MAVTSIPQFIGNEILQNPYDICLIPKEEKLVVADDVNGALVFHLSGDLLYHKKEVSDCGSVAFDSKNNLVLLSVKKARSKGDVVPAEIHFYPTDLAKRVAQVEMPLEPQIDPTCVRWLTVKPANGDIFVCAGDNTTSALWKYDRTRSIWTTLLQRTGDLEHISYVGNDGRYDQLLVVEWNGNSWAVKKLYFTADNKLQSEETVSKECPIGMFEPWSACMDSLSGTAYVYNYQAPGQIFRLSPPDYTAFPIVTLGGGKWISMAVWRKWLFAAASDDGTVRAIRLSD